MNDICCKYRENSPAIYHCLQCIAYTTEEAAIDGFFLSS